MVWFILFINYKFSVCSANALRFKIDLCLNGFWREINTSYLELSCSSVWLMVGLLYKEPILLLVSDVYDLLHMLIDCSLFPFFLSLSNTLTCIHVKSSKPLVVITGKPYFNIHLCHVNLIAIISCQCFPKCLFDIMLGIFQYFGLVITHLRFSK